MSLKTPSGGQRPLPPAGTQAATCYAIIDLGTQKKQYPGKPESWTPTLMISWELPNLEKQVFDETKGPQPFAIHETFTTSVSEKSNLYKVMTSWRGIHPTDLEKELPLFVGQSCLVNIIHNPSADKTKMYANIEGVMSLPKNFPVNTMSNKKVFFNLDTYSHQSFMELPEWIRKKIMACQEWPTIVAKYGNPPLPQEQGQQQQQGQQNQGFGQNQPPIAQNQGFTQPPVQQQQNQLHPQNTGIVSGNPFDQDPPF